MHYLFFSERRKGIFLLFSVIALLAPVFNVQAQKQYPQGYFMFPIMPGQPNGIAGNMGELRPNHFHAGLDVRTQGREGLPIHASADGYVSRIKIARGGYGNALYLTHPNGYVTVYAHIKTFNKVIGEYLRQQQYAQQTFEIELLPDSTQLRVKKGEIVAFSGNTGGSGGPHLHYEIRDKQDIVYNPQYFGFSEVKDNISPVIDRIALQAMGPSARVKGEFGRFEFIPAKTGANSYAVSNPISVWGPIGLELLSSDLTNGSGGRNGISGIEVKMDNAVVFNHHLEKFSFDVSRSINVHINYPVFMRNGSRFQRCYVADGNELGTYKTSSKGRGVINIQDNNPHTVVVTVWDADQNSSRLQFTLKGVQPVPPSPVVNVSNTPASWQAELQENTLVLKRKVGQAGSAHAPIYVKGRLSEIPPAYVQGSEIVYLWDMRKAVPDSVGELAGIKSKAFNFKATVASRQRYLYDESFLSILFDEKSLLDTLYLETGRQENRFQIGRTDVPLKDKINIRLKPDVTGDLSKTKAYIVKGGRLNYVGGTWVGNEISFDVKELGTFTVAADNVPPVAKLVVRSTSRIACTITDNLSGIGEIKAYLNGEWLLMQYDYKTNLIWSDPLDKDKPLKGNFVLEVTDNAGNATKLEAQL